MQEPDSQSPQIPSFAALLKTKLAFSPEGHGQLIPSDIHSSSNLLDSTKLEESNHLKKLKDYGSI
jgi:hypothetical protein